MYKPTDVFLTIVDFFSIIIPGGFLSFIIYQNYSATLDCLMQLNEKQYWVAFFFFSYFFGYIISHVGEKIDKRRNSNYTINQEFSSLWATVDKVRNELEKEPNTISIYQWCRSVLITTSPQAMSEINRIIASTDFFRNLYVVFPVISVASLINQNWIIGVSFALLTLPCLYFSTQGRIKLLKRISQHVIVLHTLGKLKNSQ